MSMITLFFGTEILSMSKQQVIRLIKSSPLIPFEDREKYLNDWAAATGETLTNNDYQSVAEGVPR